MNRVYLSIGSNLGDRGGNLQKALISLERWGIKILRSSKIYETEPVGLKEQPWFYNMAVRAETTLTPEETLKAISAIESALGRVRGHAVGGHVVTVGGSREIDIDILLYDDLILDTECLTIPHPRAHERNFVLVPMEEIAEEVVHPVLKRTIAELLKECNDTAIVRAI